MKILKIKTSNRSISNTQTIKQKKNKNTVSFCCTFVTKKLCNRTTTTLGCTKHYILLNAIICEKAKTHCDKKALNIDK